MKKKKTLKPKSIPQSRALVIQQVDLAPNQKTMIAIPTPPEFIKQREGKGGKTFTYIEGGYVISRLNQIFSPAGWDFEIVDKGLVAEGKEAWVQGKLTLKDFKGNMIVKTQFGSAERITERGGVKMNVGDAYKTASTDALKKCASLIGISLDVYWAQMDDYKPAQTQIALVKPIKTALLRDLVAQAIKGIRICQDKALLNQWKGKIQVSKLYSDQQKQFLIRQIDDRLKEI